MFSSEDSLESLRLLMDTHETKQTKSLADHESDARDRKDDKGKGQDEMTKSPTTTKSAIEKTPKVSESGHKKNNVRKLRTERMMSKAELARRAGLSTLTIDRVEKGMPCRMDTKRKILEALGLTPSDRIAVFGEED